MLPQLAFNPIRHADACQVCLGSRDWPSHPDCNSCRALIGQASAEQLADLVVPLTYAGEVTPQLRHDIRQYKDGRDDDSRAEALQRLSALAWHFFHFHGRCLDAAGNPVSHILTVPSGAPGRHRGGHPLEILASFAPPHWQRVSLLRIETAAGRHLDTTSLTMEEGSDVAGRHVVVFDDTWTTGSKAQSAALVARRAGAAQVTVVVVARIMNSDWGPTAAFLETHPKIPWSGLVCPVTGSNCPE
jgi:predicted amidophosphoribosyltransferase